MRYRTDIEGLRALAILPILLFHVGFGAVRGGYTGVDVFFVISGFLITQILMNDFRNDEFSIVRFYQRRFARILPALLIVLLAVMIMAPYVLPVPDKIAEADTSVAAAAGFLSNIYFWDTVGYFAHAAESRVLLHTWSLGVEEQFYVFFPLLLLLFKNMQNRWIATAFLILTLASFGSGLAVHTSYPASDFYLIPCRAWEFFIGGLVGLNALPQCGVKLTNALAVCGLILIAGSAALLATWLPFPTPFALAPAVGAALVIGYGEKTTAGRLLSFRPIRWIGKISYSLYLWHWPIITFYRQLAGDGVGLPQAATLLAVSTGVASLSYYLVERPAQRYLRSLPSGRTVIIGLFGVIIVSGAALLLAYNARRLWPVSPVVARIAAFEDYVDMHHDAAWNQSVACFVSSPSETFDVDTCLATKPGIRNVVLLGDSHANMYAAPLRRRFLNIHWLQATYFGCPPVVGGSRDWQCTAMVNRVVDDLASSGKIQGIILAGRWRANQAVGLAATVRKLRSKGLSVTVIGPVNEYEGAFPILLARAVKSGDPNSVRRFSVSDRSQVDAIIEQAALSGGAQYVSAYKDICPNGRCRLFGRDNTPVEFDYGHLTDPGAELVINGMKQP